MEFTQEQKEFIAKEQANAVKEAIDTNTIEMNKKFENFEKKSKVKTEKKMSSIQEQVDSAVAKSLETLSIANERKQMLKNSGASNETAELLMKSKDNDFFKEENFNNYKKENSNLFKKTIDFQSNETAENNQLVDNKTEKELMYEEAGKIARGEIKGPEE